MCSGFYLQKVRHLQNNNMSPKQDNQPSRRLPDFGICRAERMGKDGVPFCRVANPQDCAHAGFSEGHAFCCHPQSDQIILRTQSAQKK